ncbi:MAG: alpha/beta fold hydrolase [Kutzneria sp.]|nr:alpha/beta fold hydrolase [Kutzneria sp.]MBV9844832.1 alpha/beta fold hydrolase [Kutzneria sp.]
MTALATCVCASAAAAALVQCASVRVPVDWQHPDGASTSLAMALLPALDQRERAGNLLMNPGGPGGSGVQVLAFGGIMFGAPELAPLRQHFDIIGFDPRGVGDSGQVACTPSLLHDPHVSMFPSTPAQYDQLVELDRAAGRSCQPAVLLPFVDTISAARDIDAIRAALGERTISWFGVSYGTELGQVYAANFPHRVRAMVLDGAIDHARPVGRDAIDESSAIEHEFIRFAAWCARQTSCALHDHDVPALFDQLNEQAERSAVVATSPHRAVTAEEITQGTYGYLYFPGDWPDLAVALRQAGGVDGSADASALVSRAEFTDPSYGAYRAIGCHDFAPQLSGFADLSARAALVRVAAPHMWRYSEIWDWTSGCAGWPFHALNPPRPIHVSGTPPILVVGNTYDPATPYPWARALAAQIDNSVLLTDTVDGHTGLYNSACARQREVDYLVSGRLPAVALTCTN